MLFQMVVRPDNGAITVASLIVRFLFEGTRDTNTFNLWLEQQHVPDLKRGMVIVLLPLPPHSPDLNPIE